MISVYAHSRHQSKADVMFTEYMERVRLKTLPPAISVFGSYLNVIAHCGNIQGIPEMITLLKQHGLEMNAIITNKKDYLSL